MKFPETPVSPGRENEALGEHIDKLANQATLKQAQRLARELENEERKKQRLLKLALISFSVVGLFVLVVVIVLWLSS